MVQNRARDAFGPRCFVKIVPKERETASKLKLVTGGRHYFSHTHACLSCLSRVENGVYFL